MPGTVDDSSLQAPEPPPLEESGSVQRIVVVNQEVSVEVDFQNRSIQGETKLSIFCLDSKDQPDEIALDARQFDIALDKITVNGKKPASATYRDPYEALDVPSEYDLTPAHHTVLKDRMRALLPRPRKDLALENRESIGCTPADGSLHISLREAAPQQSQGSSVQRIRLLNNAFISSDGLYEIVVPFRASHIRDGLHFVGVEDGDARYPHVYTRHSYEPGTASCIFPCIDDPGMRCTWQIHVKCPRTLADALRQPLASQPTSTNSARPSKGRSSRDVVMTEEDKLLDMTVVCSGVLIGEKVDEADDTKKIMSFDITEHPAAPHHVGFAVGPFEHVDLFSEFRSEEDDEKLGASALKIHGYCLPGREDEVRNSCEALAAAADEFAMTYGRYPYDSYKVCFVEDMIADTVPLLSFSLCSTRLLFPEGIIDTEIDVTRKLVHSLACQYFGVYIVPNQRTDIWLTVGISYYMTDLFLARLCGNNDYRFRIKTMADQLLREDINRPSLHDLGTYLYLGDAQMQFMALKAPLVLFILDKRMTKAAGSAGASLARAISRIISKANTSGYGDIKSEIISSESFQKLCDKTASSQSSKLENFWAQFVQGSGLPYLEIKQRFNKKRLCVEVTIRERQDTERKTHPLQKDTFFRELLEKRQRVPVQTIPSLFTGSMTIRIHEANGTPYEHIVDIREDAGRGVKFDIPYNTKYKRLKRNKKNKERATAAALADGENQEDAIVFSLGDKLDTPEEIQAWNLVDWSEGDEKNMENDSYEWIRIDSDFEWIFDGLANFSPWMYTSQLQQDRDVAAQQDTLVYLSKLTAHPMAATVLTRTLYDDRYFHGLRTMAAEILSKQSLKSDADVDFRGLGQLIRVFRTFFCYPDSNTPRPNNFADKRQYMVQLAIPKAIAKVQFDGKHPREAQRFLLEQLQFNNNNSNIYSDHFYVASLLEALATSLTSSHSTTLKKSAAAEMSFSFDSDGEGELDVDGDEPMIDIEGKELLEQALAEIERYRRMDEWTASYHNIWTIAALNCKKILMKAGVIPMSPLDFVQYLHDGTLDLVRITAFEALIDLGLILRPVVLELLLSVMTTSSSPYMRDCLFKHFCQGLAGLAFGEIAEPAQPEQQAPVQEEGDLVVQQADAIIETKKADVARKVDIMVSIAALREQLKDNKEFRAAMWRAVNSPVIGCTEKRNLLELCDVLFEGESNFVVTVRHPTRWTVEAVGQAPRIKLNFKAVPRPIREAPPPPPLPAPAPAAPAPVDIAPSVMSPPPITEAKKPAGNRIKFQSSRSSLGALPLVSPPPAAPRTALPSSASAPAIDSISVQPAQRAALPTSRPAPAPNGGPSAAPPPPPASSTMEITARPKAAASTKRKSEDPHVDSSRPRKIVKVQMPRNYHKKLRDDTRQWIESSSASPSPRAASVQSSDSIRAAGPSLVARSGPSSMSPAAAGVNKPRSPSVGAAAKPARRPLPTGAPPTPSQANGSVATATAAAPPPSASPPAEAPKPKTLLKIKFKPKPPQP